MSFSRHLRRSSRPTVALNDFVWIGDDQLQHVFRIFSHNLVCRRKVTFKPGPLESRKRSYNHRRLVNVTPAAGSPYLDPDLLAGLGEKARTGKWNWEAAEEPKKNDSQDGWSLPAWLTASPVSPTHEIAQNIERPTEVSGRPGDPGCLMQQFRACTTLDALKVVAAKADIKLKAYSRLAFRQLVETKQPLETLLGFLEDPNLNDPKVKNVRYLLLTQLTQSGGHEENQESANRMATWLRQQLAMGQLSELEITELLQTLSGLAKTSINDPTICYLVEQIMKGIGACRILDTSAIKWTILAKLLECLSKACVSQRSRQLGYEILKMVPPWHIQLFEGALSNLIFGIFQNAGPQRIDLYAQLTELLAQLSNKQMKRSFVVRASKALIEDLYSKPISPTERSRLLELWYTGIAERSPGLVPQANTLARVASFQSCEKLAPQLCHLDDSKLAYFILQYWMKARHQKVEMRIPDSQQHRFADLTSIISRAAQDSPSAVPQLLTRLFEILQAVSRSAVIVDIILKAPKSEIKIPLALILEQVRLQLGENPVYARKLFRSDSRLCLEHCPELAEHIIEHGNIHPDAVWYYLKQGPQLREEYVYVLSLKKGWRHARAELYGRMAEAFAKSKHLSSRMALRHVHRCYSEHKKEGLGPVRYPLSRALVTAGIILPLRHKRWVGLIKLRWVLSVVRNVEGHDVAEQIQRLVYIWRKEVLLHLRMKAEYAKIRRAVELETRWSRRKRKFVKPLPLPTTHFRNFPRRCETR